MNFFLCAVTLVVVTILFANVKADEEKCGIINAGSYVFKQSKLKAWDDKCLYDCIMRESNLLRYKDPMKDLIDGDLFVNYVNRYDLFNDTTIEHLRKLMKTCESYRHTTDHRCQNAGNLLQCTSDKSKEYGFDPMIVPKAIQFVYYNAYGDYWDFEVKRQVEMVLQCPRIHWWWPKYPYQ